MSKNQLLLALFISTLSLPVFSAEVDPNTPRAGLYRYEMKAVSKHDSGNTTIKSDTDSAGNYKQTMDSNGRTVNKMQGQEQGKEICIDPTKGDPAQKQKMMANCKTIGKPVRTGNTTVATSECSGIKTTVWNTKVSDNVYETRSEISMAGSKHSSTNVWTRVGDCKL